ncbi:DUF433 domain-containing protein [Dyadobacter psychrotolerans]|uniref:DUF433 domain-containing protein n=1 Tax=Dyadobacter psychrotolerans TaxID=2541721 RepID=A0A4R5DFH0_9BACT|nr:DUF433 domain-containing protein [Dyadobacter psychrotolerans]TDE12509.1 DUF433 domain-containing protein [Dyadobacter psychrotolerans]
MNYRDHIVSDHKVMLGKPVIKGTRLSVELILRKLGEGVTTEQLLAMYPDLEREAIQAVLIYAAKLVANEENIESAA